MAANLNFITAVSSGSYVVVDTSTGANNPPYNGKYLQIVSLDGTTLYTSPNQSLDYNTFTIPFTNDWNTHLGIVQIKVTLNYFNGNDTESLAVTYSFPTTLNIKTAIL